MKEDMCLLFGLAWLREVISYEDVGVDLEGT